MKGWSGLPLCFCQEHLGEKCWKNVISRTDVSEGTTQSKRGRAQTVHRSWKSGTVVAPLIIIAGHFGGFDLSFLAVKELKLCQSCSALCTSAFQFEMFISFFLVACAGSGQLPVHAGGNTDVCWFRCLHKVHVQLSPHIYYTYR